MLVERGSSAWGGKKQFAIVGGRDLSAAVCFDSRCFAREATKSSAGEKQSSHPSVSRAAKDLGVA